VAEGARLESVYRFIPIEGSNPSLSAKYYNQATFSRGLIVLRVMKAGNQTYQIMFILELAIHK
jgi:hypothetical protein